jgi:hypothetical protein
MRQGAINKGKLVGAAAATAINDIDLRATALRMAMESEATFGGFLRRSGDPDKTVARAQAYYDFLTGGQSDEEAQ